MFGLRFVALFLFRPLAQIRLRSFEIIYMTSYYALDYRPKKPPKLPKLKAPTLAPAPNCALACPFCRAKFEVRAGLKPPLLSPTLRPVPTTGAIGIPF